MEFHFMNINFYLEGKLETIRVMRFHVALCTILQYAWRPLDDLKFIHITFPYKCKHFPIT